MITGPTMAIATGLYSGYLPKAPGTWGSLVGVLLYLLLAGLSLPACLLVIAALLIIGTFTPGEAEKILNQEDPKVVVIDEIAGMLITLAGTRPEPLLLLAGFLLFRFFDILKPFPINLIDQRLHGGLGIMLDDVVAGLFSLALLQGISLIL